MPLFISSLCVSVHLPVRACVRLVFPWSTCPTIPMFTSGFSSFSLCFASVFLGKETTPASLERTKLSHTMKESHSFNARIMKSNIKKRSGPFYYGSALIVIMGDERKREIDRLLDEEFRKKEKGFMRRHILLIMALIPIIFFNMLTLLVIIGVI